MKDTCAELPGLREMQPWTRSIDLVLQHPARLASLRSHEQVTGREPTLIFSPGPVWGPARSGHHQFWCRKLSAHPPCSEFHHCFQERTPSSSATYSQQACGMINALNITKCLCPVPILKAEVVYFHHNKPQRELDKCSSCESTHCSRVQQLAASE